MAGAGDIARHASVAVLAVMAARGALVGVAVKSFGSHVGLCNHVGVAVAVTAAKIRVWLHHWYLLHVCHAYYYQAPSLLLLSLCPPLLCPPLRPPLIRGYCYCTCGWWYYCCATLFAIRICCWSATFCFCICCIWFWSARVAANWFAVLSCVAVWPCTKFYTAWLYRSSSVRFCTMLMPNPYCCAVMVGFCSMYFCPQKGRTWIHCLSFFSFSSQTLRLTANIKVLLM